VRYRPGYPGGILDVLRDRCGLDAESVVVDVGSGTGALSRVFLENGNRVFGVEPNTEMRHAGERLLADYEGFSSVVGTAERTTLPDGRADFVTAGQAFHWFDLAPTRAEFLRILRPGGWVVLVWNERKAEAAGFAAAYERLLEAHGTDYEQVRHDGREKTDQMQRFFHPSSVETAVFDNAQTFDLAGIKGRLLSSSYVPAVGEPGCARMLDELEDIFRQHERDGQVILRYATRLYFGVLTDA
jgi:SAM-dependent methyltransferase